MQTNHCDQQAVIQLKCMRSFLLVLCFANVHVCTFLHFLHSLLNYLQQILKPLELENRCLLFLVLFPLDIIQGPPLCCLQQFTSSVNICIVKIISPKIGKILKVEINLSFLKLMYLGQLVSDLSKLGLKIVVRVFSTEIKRKFYN